MKLHKIRNRETGEYSQGGGSPSWSKAGKTWNGMGPVKLHLNEVRHAASRGSRPAERYLMDAELVEYIAVENTVTPLAEVVR